MRVLVLRLNIRRMTSRHNRSQNPREDVGLTNSGCNQGAQVHSAP